MARKKKSKKAYLVPLPRREGVEIADPAAFLRKKMPQLRKWLLEIFRHDRMLNAHITLRDYTEKGPPDVAISLWSEHSEFVISARMPSGKQVTRSVGPADRQALREGRITQDQLRKRTQLDPGSLIAGMSCRAPYAGEQHRRHSDLADGFFDERSWRAIVADILQNCLVELHEWARNRRGDGPRPIRPPPISTLHQRALRAQRRKRRRGGKHHKKAA